MATDRETNPQRRIEDQKAAAKIDWANPEAPAVPLSSTAGAARQGGITSLDGLESFNASRKHLGAMERCERGNYLRRVDVERLFASQVEAAAPLTFSEQDIPADAPRVFAKRYSALLDENEKLKVAPAAAAVQAPQTDELILAARAEGRAEAVEILSGLCVETGIDEYTGWGRSGAPEDEGAAYWKVEKLRELFKCDDKLHNLFDRAEAMYWQAKAEKDEAEREMNMVRRAPFYKPLSDFLSKHQAWDLMADLKRAAEAAQAPQQTELNDERLAELFEQATTYPPADEDYAGIRLFATLIAREVLANKAAQSPQQNESVEPPPLPKNGIAYKLAEAATNPHYSREDYARWMREGSDAVHALTGWAERAYKLLAQAAQAAPSTQEQVTNDEAKLYRDLTGDAMKLGYDGIPAALEALRVAAPSAPAEPSSAILDVPSAIMNIPCRRADSDFPDTASRLLYKEGHRDARHAAADLVLEQADKLAALAAPVAAVQQADVRDQVLEEAARKVEGFRREMCIPSLTEIAVAIRSLRTPSTSKGDQAAGGAE